MPELVDGGPVIPASLLNARDEHQLVFFCGAGVSAPSGLPGFKKLVDTVLAGSGLEKDALERRAYKNKEFDRVLGLLEREGRIGRERLRAQVVRILSAPASRGLEIHDALLALSRTPRGRRLVTTNFDLRFCEAGLSSTEVDSGPRLPIPKRHSWESVVHLHGWIADSANPDELVLTSADFGRAYLADRWATRFVVELFREFTIVFVGYSLEDPVMRYLVDALAAERARGVSFLCPYAFVGHGKADRESVYDEWKAKGVEPVLFDRRNKFRLLSESLSAWAEITKDPLRSRRQLLLEKVVALPEASSVERVCWSLRDSDVARELGSATPADGPVEAATLVAWLDEFEKRGLFNAQARPYVSTIARSDQVVEPAAATSVAHSLCWWLARNAHLSEVLSWLVGGRRAIGPVLGRALGAELSRDQSGVAGNLRELWAATIQYIPIDPWECMTLSRAISAAKSTRERGIYERALLRALEPRLRPKPRAKTGEGSDPGAYLVVETPESRFWEPFETQGAYLEHAETFTGHLAMTVGLPGEGPWGKVPSYWSRPSIAVHAQNREQGGESRLIDLVRDSYLALAGAQSDRAKSLLQQWALVDHPLFRRLQLHAITEHAESRTSIARRLLLRESASGLWDSELRRETLRFLRLVGPRLPASFRKELLAAVDRGPAEPSWDTEVVRREISLRRQRLLADGPEDREEDPKGNREEFLVWSEGTSWTSLESVAQIEKLSAGEIVRRVGQGRATELEMDRLVSADPVKACTVLRLLAADEAWPTNLWLRVLWGITANASDRRPGLRRERFLMRLLDSAPNEVLRSLRHPVSDVLVRLAHSCSSTEEVRYADRWFRLSTVLKDEASECSADDVLTRALNDPSGKLAQAALVRLAKHNPRQPAGIPSPVQRYFRELGVAKWAHLGRVILMSNVNRLFLIDPDWVRAALVPRLQPRNCEEAVGLWCGFAWSASIGPSLLSVIKDEFLAAVVEFERCGNVGENLVNLLVQISLTPKPFPISDIDCRQALRQLSEKGLCIVIEWMRSRLVTSEDAASAWRNRIRPWLERYWPASVAGATDRLSVAIVRLVVEAEDAYGDAAQWALGQVVPLRGSGLWWIESSRCVERAPDKTLSLLERLVDDKLEYAERIHLEKILGRIRGSLTGIESDPKYERLRKIASVR